MSGTFIKYYQGHKVKKKMDRACGKHWEGVEVHTEVSWKNRSERMIYKTYP